MKSFSFVNIAKEDWGNPRRARKQLLFEALAKRSEVEEVLYLDPPHHFWNPCQKTNSSIEGIKVWQSHFLFPGERFSCVRAVNRTILYIKLYKYLKNRPRWYTFYYHPLNEFLSHLMSRHGPVFYDWTEDWSAYYADPILSTYQKKAIKSATGVIVVSKLLEERVRELINDDKKVLFLPNATSWKPPKSNPFLEEDINKIGFPRIGFFGHVGPWFDKEMVIELSRARPQWQWIIIGYVDKVYREEFASLPNIHLFGQKPYNELPAYAAQCQILIAPYRKNILGDGTKLYDYLTVGHPIISSNIETAKHLQPFVHIANGFRSWLNVLTETLSKKNTYLCKAMQKESLNHTWDIRANVLLNWLKQINDEKSQKN